MNAAIACFVWATVAPAQVDMESLIHQALDQVVHFEVVDKPLPEAFLTVAEQTGVAISISPESLKLLPHGANTRMTARMKNIPLRDGIERLVKPLGMRYRVAGDGLVVEPAPALRRIGRRATWDELETLQWLGSLEWSAGEEGWGALRDRLHFQVDHDAPAEALLQSLNRAGAGPASEVLSRACEAVGWTWYPSGKRIVVIERGRQIQRELSRPITLRAQHQRLSDVLAELAQKAHMTFHFEPGAVASVPHETRRDFSVLLVDASVEQALEVICGATGLSFAVGRDGVRFSNPQRPTSSDRPVAILMIPGRGEILIYEKDLPPDVKEALETLIDRLIKAVPPPEDSANAEQPSR
ncbi:MAG: hypothetical protein V3W34_04225 [Phycisphaerae bacterium]